jgi:probable HAF family extracellular repeat protein
MTPYSHVQMTAARRIRAAFLLGAIVGLPLLVSSAPSRAQSYRITDLGTLPGDLKSVALSFNDLGQAVGSSSNPSGAIAALFSGGRVTNLNTLNADVSVATAINGFGQVVGYNIFYNTATTVFRAFLYSGGTMMDIHSPSLFPSGTIAYGINSSQEVVGEGLLTDSVFHAFLRSGSQTIDLGTLGGSQASAYSVNDSGEIAGSSVTAKGDQHAFLYANGRMADLGVPAGAFASGAKAINRNGEIVGDIFLNTGPSHAALYSNGAWVDLGAVPGAVSTQATGINGLGQIVGTAIFPVRSYHPFRPGKHVGFIVSGGSLVDLNTLVPANSGFTITDAVGINDSGQILCDATNASGYEHAILLTPK